MTQVASRYSTMIIIGAIILWLLVLTGSGWWMWSKYQTATKADPSPAKATKEELKIDQLNQAVKLLGG